MSALTLPPPINHDVSQTESQIQDANGSSDSADVMKTSEELLKGIIYPSREIRGIIDKTASHIAKSPSPQLLEDKIRESQRSDPKFSFLRDSDPFNRYYRYMIEKIKEDGEDVALSASTGAGVADDHPESADPNAAEKENEEQRRSREEALKKAKRVEKLEEPRAFDFLVELPNVTAIDLDTLRLAALFTARRGRKFLENLSVREGRNYQFDFLRPSHSLYGYFNRMVEQYTKVLHPAEDQLARLRRGLTDRWQTLEECKKRGEWEKVRKDKEQQKREEAEREAQAFAEIDWQDFAVVQNIEFTTADQTIDLPPPTSIDALRMMGLNEKRMAALIVEQTGGEQMGQESRPVDGNGDGEMDVDMDEDSEDEESKVQRLRDAEELARARELQAKAMGQAGMKIRNDYQPKGLAGRQAGRAKVATAICPYCKQSIPEAEMSEHIRIELLDPRYREQQQHLEQRKTQQALLTENSDVAGSLKQLANARTDLFGTAEEEEKRKQQEDEERAARRAKEAIIWDGHTASKATTLETFQNKFNLDDQIAAIQRKHHLVSGAQTNAIGPQLGAAPAEMPPAQAAGAQTPGGGTAFTGAVLSAGPSAPSALQPVNPYGQFMPFHDQPAFDPSIFNSSPMPHQLQPMAPTDASAGGRPAAVAMHPSRMAALGGPPPFQGGSPVPPVAGQTRPFEAMQSPGEDPSSKRPRVDKLPGGQYYPEADWISMHPNPISISVQLPTMPEKPEWKLNGSIITISDLPLNFLVSSLRDRIAGIIEAQLPISRMRLDFGTKVLSNASTLASVNLDEGDMIVLSIRKK